jgi:hypothetical protein
MSIVALVVPVVAIGGVFVVAVVVAIVVSILRDRQL